MKHPLWLAVLLLAPPVLGEEHPCKTKAWSLGQAPNYFVQFAKAFGDAREKLPSENVSNPTALSDRCAHSADPQACGALADWGFIRNAGIKSYSAGWKRMSEIESGSGVGSELRPLNQTDVNEVREPICTAYERRKTQLAQAKAKEQTVLDAAQAEKNRKIQESLAKNRIDGGRTSTVVDDAASNGQALAGSAPAAVASQAACPQACAAALKRCNSTATGVLQLNADNKACADAMTSPDCASCK